MHISKIEIENIKSYEQAVFEFGRGTTAIMGENGAGKTTIIEAVAWVLFDLLDYKKDDFLKRGANRGHVTIEFESGLDERRYIVQRDTRTAYFVYDPKLKTRIADKKEEVTRFLWQHLGVEAGTDLESLFRRAIGVPQGTFTAIFLETPNERKKAFDKLLKVEEYRIGSIKLGQTAKYVDVKTLDVIQKIARAEGELSNLEKNKAELKTFSSTGKEFAAELKKTEKKVKSQRKSVEKLEKNKKRFDELKTESDKLDRERARLELVLKQQKRDLENAQKAAEFVKANEDAHTAHNKALGMIKELERERTAREKLLAELHDIEKAIAKVKAEQQSVKTRLDEVEKKRKTIAELEPKVKLQIELEEKKKILEIQIVKKRSAIDRAGVLEKSLVVLRDRHKSNEKEIKTVESFQTAAAEATNLKTRDQEIRTSLAGVRARIERDREFQVQVEDGMCPVFSAKCMNLKPGDTLDSFLSDRFGELETQVQTLEKEQVSVSNSLKTAMEAASAVIRMTDLLKNKENIVAEGTALREQQAGFKDKAEGFEADVEALKKIESDLAGLGDPRGKSEYLKKDSDQIKTLRENATKAESNFERLESDRRIKVQQLESYKDLDSNWEEFTKKREETSEAHREYIKNEALSKSLPAATLASEQTAKELHSAADKSSKSITALDAAKKDFDPELFGEEMAKLRNSELVLERVSADAKHSSQRKAEIETEIDRLGKIKEQLSLDKNEKDRLDRLAATIAFIRTTLKSAAPRVAKNYVFHVSVEANTLYREITGNAESTLKWTDDYGIELEQDGFTRPFISLSGGEQMSAALAVRLALLRQLSDIKLAFFDEPTTNMDLERRERLAEQISRITENQTFDQLFVISHDDTFESYVDHVLDLG